MNDSELTPLKLNTQEILEDYPKTVENALKVIDDTDKFVSERFGVLGAKKTELIDEALVYRVEEATLVTDVVEKVKTVVVEGALERLGAKNTTGENPIIDIEKDGLNSEVTSAMQELISEDAKLPTGESVATLAAEVINTNEVLISSIKRFVEQFQGASIEQKKVAVAEFYSAIDDVYGVKYRGKSVSLNFSESGDYIFNHDGFIRVPLDRLEKQIPNETIFSILHEYRHAMQPSLGILSSGSGLPSFTRLSHDMRSEEIDATQFAFENMDKSGVDKTKISRYKDWQEAIRIVDTINLLKQNYSQEIADKMLDIYKLLDEYTLQTNRTDQVSGVVKEQFHKIQKKINFRSNITSARAKLAELNKVAKTNDDKFLLKAVSNIRTDWPQYL